jgi:tetratricopeptide (TPR) repeat protein
MQARVAEGVRLQPADADAHLNEGDVALAMGDRGSALEHLRRAVELDPRLGQARVRLGSLLLELNRLQEALPHCQAAAELRPDLVEAHLGLARTWLALGQDVEARESFLMALRIAPDRGPAADGMGIVAFRLHRREEALGWLRRAVELEPDSVESLRHLAEAAFAYGLTAEGRRCCERIVAIDPNDASAHNMLGSFAQEERRREDARAHYLHAVRLKPGLASAHYNLGVLHEELDEKDEAEARYRMVLQCNPSLGMALARIAAIRRGALANDDMQAIHRLLGEPGLLPAHRLKLLFGVAEVHDARGECGQAAAWLDRANALGRDLLRQREEPYIPSEHRRTMDAVAAAFTPALFDRLAGAGLEMLRPVFIVGMPRSGTTLIEQILASHPEVHGAGEIDLVLQSFKEVPAVMSWHGRTLEVIERLRPEHVDELARRHEGRLREIDGGRSARIANKRPENYIYLGLIALMFPRAVVIHCRRDPRDVALSCWSADFTEVRWAYQHDHIATRIAEYRRLMDYWRTALPGSFAVHEVDYEETVEDLDGVSRRLVAALGLEWDASCLEFHKTQRPVQSASLHQVRQPIYRSSVGRWKRYEKELAELFAMVEPAGAPR